MELFPPYDNHDLFSKWFLDKLLKQRPEWTEAQAAAASARHKLRVLYMQEKAALPSLKEPQVEARWVRPVFDILGVSYDVQPALPTDDPARTLAPDYALFGNPVEREAAQADRRGGRGDNYFKRVRMVGDAKRWGVDFISAPRGQKTPRQQLTEYLHLSRVDWGFLTDGRHWRLTHRSVAGRLDRYYQIDLVEALDAESLDHFLYFYLFFRGEALQPPVPGTPSFLDLAREESLKYAEGVGRELKESVYEALRLIARGYLARLAPSDVPDKELLRSECLTLLYRLLFLFYAEHRGLLPGADKRYHAYSLTRLADELQEPARMATLRIRGSSLWGRLDDLFALVDEGDAELNVPPYNGGLFGDEEHPLLARSGPGDRDLAQAIDLLARTSSVPQHTIDYRDLDIRHLGTIYEGLLEYRLEIAEVDLAIVADTKRRERYEPFDPARHDRLPPERRVSKGEPYLVTDRGERKTSGSFYTPDFIVEHTVEDTLGPLVRGKRPEEILKLRVLDPAMGSGHFLLEALEYLARAYGLARIEHGHAQDGVLSDKELVEFRRLISEHCLYGVDLNPMAVELAKLALWLKTMAGDRPLTFLDHHLKCGNSLLSARVERIGEKPDPKRKKGSSRSPRPRQLGLFEQIFKSRLVVILSEVMRILGQETRTRADVQLKVSIDAAVDELRQPFLAVADVALGELYGVVPSELENLIGLLHRPDQALAHRDVAAVVPLAKAKHFFHYEIMFPEVFFDPYGQRRADAGFDAVIGNPPWVRQETIKADKDALAALYPDVYNAVADIYAYFVGAGVAELAPGGRLGMVLPNKWQRADYGEALRRFLVEACRPVSLTDFGHAPIFPDADTFPCILIAERSGEHGRSAVQPLWFCSVERGDLDEIHLRSYVKRHGYSVATEQLRPEGWSPVPPDVARLLEKLRKAGMPLKEFVGGSPLYGVKTGLNEAFLIDEATRGRLIAQDPSCKTIIKKYLRGEDIDRWHARWGGKWMIFARRGFDLEQYPSVKRHLELFRTQLEPKPNGWKGDWQGRKPGSYKWFELQDTVDYFQRMEAPKIAYQEISFHSRFAFDRDGYYLNNKAFLLPTSDLGLLAVLNSSLLWWYLWFTAPHMKDEAFAMQGFYVETLPIVAAPGQRGERLVTLASERQAAESLLLDWLRADQGLAKVSQKLDAFWRLSEGEMLAEVKKVGVELTPSAVKRIKGEFGRSQAAILPLVAEERRLERENHAEVFRLYGLTDEDIALVRATAPPRDPLALLDAEG